jgi:hypothetical protein
MKSGLLECLCARRTDLQVLLVCRQWYDEAGRVLWASNTFAFENARTFVDFATSLPSRWRAVLSKVSIMAYNATNTRELKPLEQFESNVSALESKKEFAPVWPALRNLPALTELQLDGAFLTQMHIALPLLRLGLVNLRKVSFLQRNISREIFADAYHAHFMNPQYAHATRLAGGLAEQVALAIKGRRITWLKRRGAIQKATAREYEVQRAAAFGEARRQEIAGTTAVLDDMIHEKAEEPVAAAYYDEDVEEWSRIWNANASHGRTKQILHAYLPRGHP